MIAQEMASLSQEWQARFAERFETLARELHAIRGEVAAQVAQLATQDAKLEAHQENIQRLDQKVSSAAAEIAKQFIEERSRNSDEISKTRSALVTSLTQHTINVVAEEKEIRMKAIEDLHAELVSTLAHDATLARDMQSIAKAPLHDRRFQVASDAEGQCSPPSIHEFELRRKSAGQLNMEMEQLYAKLERLAIQFEEALQPNNLYQILTSQRETSKESPDQALISAAGSMTVGKTEWDAYHAGGQEELRKVRADFESMMTELRGSMQRETASVGNRCDIMRAQLEEECASNNRCLWEQLAEILCKVEREREERCREVEHLRALLVVPLAFHREGQLPAPLLEQRTNGCNVSGEMLDVEEAMDASTDGSGSTDGTGPHNPCTLSQGRLVRETRSSDSSTRAINEEQVPSESMQEAFIVAARVAAMLAEERSERKKQIDAVVQITAQLQRQLGMLRPQVWGTGDHLIEEEVSDDPNDLIASVYNYLRSGSA